MNDVNLISIIDGSVGSAVINKRQFNRAKFKSPLEFSSSILIEIIMGYLLLFVTFKLSSPLSSLKKD